MTEFIRPHQLRYRALAYRFAPGAALPLDDSYRLCHLPLIAPEHPDVISSKPGEPYDMGWFTPPSRALVVPVDAEALDASPAYRRLMTRLRAAPFAPKIAWDLQERRRPVLHATIRSHLQRQHSDAAIRHLTLRLRRLRRFRARLLGPWMGDKNHGRLYLPLVPEARHGRDPVSHLQALTGGRPTGLYTVGLVHFRDHLDATEATALRLILRDWRDRILLDTVVREIRLMANHDSLALDSCVLARIPLRGG